MDTLIIDIFGVIFINLTINDILSLTSTCKTFLNLYKFKTECTDLYTFKYRQIVPTYYECNNYKSIRNYFSSEYFSAKVPLNVNYKLFKTCKHIKKAKFIIINDFVKIYKKLKINNLDNLSDLSLYNISPEKINIDLKNLKTLKLDGIQNSKIVINKTYKINISNTKKCTIRILDAKKLNLSNIEESIITLNYCDIDYIKIKKINLTQIKEITEREINVVVDNINLFSNFFNIKTKINKLYVTDLTDILQHIQIIPVAKKYFFKNAQLSNFIKQKNCKIDYLSFYDSINKVQIQTRHYYNTFSNCWP